MLILTDVCVLLFILVPQYFAVVPMVFQGRRLGKLHVQLVQAHLYLLRSISHVGHRWPLEEKVSDSRENNSHHVVADIVGTERHFFLLDMDWMMM